MIKPTDIKSIPVSGLTPDEITDYFDTIRIGDVDWKGGRSWSLVYYIDEAHLEVLKKAYNSFLCENYISPFTFESLHQLEKEVIQMTIELLNGDQDAVGSITSGGTESIFLALYTYREHARVHRPKIKVPEVVVPASAHPAFHKAAHYLGLKVKTVKVTDNFQADPQAMEKAITADTILMIASAPSYPHGIIDPIPELAKIALKYKVSFHIDACVGGFMLPWVETLGYPVPEWDFRVKGVTSISADLHKFGYAAKGASTLLYLKESYLKHQFFIHTEWSGGIYASNTLAGSRTGGPVAAAWAAMKYLGQDGYLKIAKHLMSVRDELKLEIEKIPELKIIGQPVMNIISFTTRKNNPDLYVIADQLQQKGWMVDRQQLPASIHLTVMPYNASKIYEYIADLKVAIQFAKNNPRAASQGDAALYGLMARIPARGLVKKNINDMLLTKYKYNPTVQKQTEETGSSSAMPGTKNWMGRLNRVLKRWETMRAWLKKS